MMFSFLKTGGLALLFFLNTASGTQDGEEARWLVQASSWGTLSWMEEAVNSMAMSYGEDNGRIFFYLIAEEGMPDSFPATLTLSEAALNPDQFDGAKCGPNSDLDPEDPRCAKLSISGYANACTGDLCDFGMSALTKNHPQMADWPDDHMFKVFEMDIASLWMIANFGGGGYMDPIDYHSSTPQHHPVNGFGGRRKLSTRKISEMGNRPDFGSDDAAHARWLVAKSLWTTISTVSTKDEGNAFGNIRSVADGVCFLHSTGLPVFYLPTPDPTAIDINANNQISITFTESNLAELVVDGKPCGGMDTEDPTCAKISLSGKAVPLNEDQIVKAREAFAAQHPRARWLSSSSGAHTGGNYYTIDLENIVFLRNYGGMSYITVDEYMNWNDAAMFENEEDCVIVDDSPSSEGGQYVGTGNGDSYGHDGGSHGMDHGGDHSSGSDSHGMDHGGDHGYNGGGDHSSGGDSHGMDHGGDHGYNGGGDHSSGGDSHGMDHGGDHGYNGGGDHGSSGCDCDHGGGGGMDHGGGGGMDHGGDHGYSGGGGGHEDQGGESHGGGHQYASSQYSNNQDNTSFHLASFVYGSLFGFILWGPTIAMVVYHKCLSQGGKAEYKPAFIREPKQDII